MAPNQRLLITGASSGVGCSLVGHLKDRFEIIAVARRLARMERQFGEETNVHCYGLDLADTEALGGRVDDILDRHGPVLNLINNAGVNVSGRVEEISDEDVRQSFQVNAFAPRALMQKVLPGMQSAGFGRIINVTSGAPLNCFPEYAAYSASKGALNAFTVTAAREHEGENIKINLMSPGPVQTEMAPDAPMDPSACHPTADYLLDLGPDGPTGEFFWLGYKIPLFPDLSAVEWLEGTASDQYGQVL
ncbi:short-subunit dehydrogenase [Salinibacter ruber]|uniref:SDR family NAD(P)-dependent oxidoreductase n=1 Tax=Salinibacter ruber TaxID=146919 RepID=UPI00161FC4AA|nr:SDR family NAD(P)-dependent oxidoreductase [Salinibacter ruber]MBB4070391.1 short-subunit dehydrogenase [Salinibacter ruber]